MLQQSNKLWSKILDSKYGGWRSLVEGRRGNNESAWWKDIMEVTQDQQLNPILQDGITWRVGCGDKIKFWKDKWLGDDCNLEQQYNQLFMISGQQNNNISTMGSFSQGNWRWDLKWRRNLFDHEDDVAVAFMEEINDIPIQSHLYDNMLWKADPSGVYSTKSAYRILVTCNRHVSDVNIFQTIWKLKIPPRTAIFSWRLILDRLPTRGNLLCRIVQMQDTSCPLCGNAQEEVDHLVFNCEMTLGLWWESMSWNQMVGPIASSPAAHFIQFCEGYVIGKNQSHRYGWWVALTNSIWKHRNQVVFEGNHFQPSKVMDDALFLNWSWLKTREKHFSFSFN